MSQLSFAQWYGVGSYGGLCCALCASAAIATYALLRRRGSPLQLARAILVSLLSACAALAPIWWNQNRLDYLGPTLSLTEVTLWLTWAAISGWLIPLSILLGYLTLAAPQEAPPLTATSSTSQPLAPWQSGSYDGGPLSASIHNPARWREPLGPGVAWGSLQPQGDHTTDPPITLTRQLILLGRESDNDIVIEDERVSRRHAELTWNQGRVTLRDGGSTNGTLVNAQNVRNPITLRDGDLIEIGRRRYRYIATPTHPAQQATPAATTTDEQTNKIPATLSAPHSATPSHPTPLPSLTLVALNSHLAGATWQLTTPITDIGRDTDRRIYLPDPSVSRLHAQIIRQQTGFFISDLHSSNGVLLDGHPISAPTLLLPGDILRIGAVELRCEETPPTTAPDQQQPATLANPQNQQSPTTIPLTESEPISAARIPLLALQRAAPTRRADRVRIGPPPLTPNHHHTNESSAAAEAERPPP